MFAIPGLLSLLLFIYARPLEFIPLLKGLPLLYVCFGLALFGLVIDLRLHRNRALIAPQLGWVLAFALWCIFTLALKQPAQLPSALVDLSISLVFFVLTAHSVQSFRALEAVMATVLVLVIFLASIGVHQGLAPFGCHVLDTAALANGDAIGMYDGRECVTTRECFDNDAEPGAEYLCERVGLLGTHSVGHGRVRYLGPLQDPNELALAVGVGLPFALAFLERRRTALRWLLLFVTLGLVGLCTVYTQSRGGQLVFAAVLGAYFVKRYGWKGLALGAIMVAPLMLFGGRSGEEAAGSSAERLECWYEGMSMFKSAPIFGVGLFQFTEHHYLTAHNSYVLAVAELGFPGLFLFSVVLYLSTKIPVRVLADFREDPEAAVARSWAMAMLAAMVGLLVGIFFLSFVYKQMLWVYIGLSGALYAAVKTHRPSWDVRIAGRELLFVALLDSGLVGALFVYTRLKS